MGWDRFIISRLFLAAPELTADGGFLRLMLANGLITQDEINVYKKLVRKTKLVRSLRGKSLIQRLMIISPEIMSVATVDLLRKLGLISIPEGHALRIALRAAHALFPIGPDPSLIVKRLVLMGDSLLSAEVISLIRAMDQANIDEWARVTRGTGRLTHAEALRLEEMVRASIDRAQAMKDIVVLGRNAASTAADAAKADNIWSAITVVGEGILNPEMLQRAARLGVISEYKYDLINALAQLGMNSWRKGIAASNQDNAMARALLVSEGVLSPEMIAALRAGGIISPGLATALYPAAKIIRDITRNNLAQYMKSTKLHIRPNETPIQAYGRVSQMTDRGLLKLLAAAANDSRKEAELLAKSAKFGKMTKAAQQRLVERSLHLQMHSLYENVGSLTIFGERETARAAASSMDFMQDKMWGKRNVEIRRALRRQAESGLDSFISRSETIRPLSTRVYNNWRIVNGRLSRDINKALLRGVNARDLAGLIANSIDPQVAGGVSYNAMRLARTEINNAFHQTSIRSTIDMPWVDGYKWNISGSHVHKDVCNDMANTDHDGIGRGVYKKGNVPGKPHPHCFCYVTTVNKGAGEFEAQLKRGSYDKYLKILAKKSPGFADDAYTNLSPMDSVASRMMKKFLPMAAQMAGQAAAVGTISLATRWLEEGGTGPTTKAVAPAPKPIKPKGSGPVVVEAMSETQSFEIYSMARRADILGADAVDFASQDLWDTISTLTDRLKAQLFASQEYRSAAYRHINANARIADGDLSLIHVQWDKMMKMQGQGNYKKWLHAMEDGENDLNDLDALISAHAIPTGWSARPVPNPLTPEHLLTKEELRVKAFRAKETAVRDKWWNELDGWAKDLGYSGAQDIGFHKYFDTMTHTATEASMYESPWLHDPKKMYSILDSTMSDTQVSSIMYRISGVDWMGGLTQYTDWRGNVENVIDHEHILNNMKGTRFVDGGYVSLENIPTYYNGGGGGGLSIAGRQARYKIFVPPGVKAAYGNAAESEIILGRGYMYEVMSVVQSTNENFAFDVEIRVLPHKPQ